MASEQSRRGWVTSVRHRDLRILLGAIGVSGTGDWLYSVALAVFVFDQTHSAAWVGASVLARQLAYMTATTPMAVLGDRVERRRWLITINMLQTVVMLGLTTVAALDGPAAAAIGLAFCSTVLGSGYFPAVFAAVPALVPEDHLGVANGVIATIEQTTFVAGPAIGAAILAIAGSAAPAFAINAATFLLAAVFVSRLPRMQRSETDEPEGLRVRITRGVRVLRDVPEALVITILTAATLFVYGFEQVLWVIVAAAAVAAEPSRADRRASVRPRHEACACAH